MQSSSRAALAAQLQALGINEPELVANGVDTRALSRTRRTGQAGAAGAHWWMNPNVLKADQQTMPAGLNPQTPLDSDCRPLIAPS